MGAGVGRGKSLGPRVGREPRESVKKWRDMLYSISSRKYGMVRIFSLDGRDRGGEGGASSNDDHGAPKLGE